MTAADPKTGEITNLPAPRRERAYAVVEHPIPMFDTARFEHMQRVADMISYSTRLPMHWQGKSDKEAVANCFVLLNLAQAFDVDPLFLAQETFLTPNGQIGYTGKLIAANLERKFKIVLDYDVSGAGDDMKIVASGKRPSDGKTVTVEGTVGRWKKEKNPNWTSQPEDMLIFRATRQWARRYFPAAMLGMLSEDDMDDLRENMRAASTPSGQAGRAALMERLQAGGGQAPDIVGHVARETGEAGSGVTIENEDTQESDAVLVAGSDGPGEGVADQGVGGSSASTRAKAPPPETTTAAQDAPKAGEAGKVAADADKGSGEAQNGSQTPSSGEKKQTPAEKRAAAAAAKAKAEKDAADEAKREADEEAQKAKQPATEPEWMADMSPAHIEVYDSVVERLQNVSAWGEWRQFKKDYRDSAKGIIEDEKSGFPAAARDHLLKMMDSVQEKGGW